LDCLTTTVVVVYIQAVAPEPAGTGGHVPPLFQMAGHGGHRERTFNYHNLLWYANYKCQKSRM